MSKRPWIRKPPIRITLEMYRVMRGKTRERTKVEPKREACDGASITDREGAEVRS